LNRRRYREPLCASEKFASAPRTFAPRCTPRSRQAIAAMIGT
jgi:hypothetical protein